MLIELSGALNGKIRDLYTDCRADWILCTGSFGCFPDPHNLDKATRRHGVGDFPELYLADYTVPVPTVFVRGVHEDHRWLAQRANQRDLNVLGNVTWLMDGYETVIGDTDTSCRVLGLGKTYSPKAWNDTRSGRHVTQRDVSRACSAGPVDILLCHQFHEVAVKRIIYATRPKIVIYGNGAEFTETSTLGTLTLGIPKHFSLKVEWDGEKITVL